MSPDFFVTYVPDRSSHLLKSRVDDLSNPTRLNLAHVYANRDVNRDLDTALDLLYPILGKPEGLVALSIWKEIGERMLLKSKEQGEARSRNYGERLGLYFQANVLGRWIEARKILKTTEINTKSYFSAKEKLTEIRNKIDESEELKWEMRNDLLADTWTKSGFLNYLEAFHEEIQNGDTLQEAENCLNRALQYKPSWLPAQIYLAMAYLAEKQWDKAAEELNSVLGTPKQAAAPVSQTITSSS